MRSRRNLTQALLASRAFFGAAVIFVVVFVVVSLISGGGAVVFGLAFCVFYVLRQQRNAVGSHRTPS